MAPLPIIIMSQPVCSYIRAASFGVKTSPFPTTGIEFSMTALFLIILINQWEATKEHKPVLTGAAISVVCLLIFGRDNFLIPSMIGITAALFLEKKYMKTEEEEAKDDN